MVFITGASGLVGSHLLRRLVKEGQQVRALYRSAIPSIEGAEQVEWVQGDILDIASLEEALQGVDHVYHCAAVVSFNPRKRPMMYKINVEGTANVVNVCLSANIRRMVYVSSIAAMGRIRENSPIDEEMFWSEETSNSAYGKTKYLAELEIFRGIGEGLDIAIVNPVVILGAGDWNKGSTEIFKTAYDEFPWYTEGTGGFVDVEDVARAMILLMNAPNVSSERFILSGVNMSYKDLFVSIARQFNKKPPHKKVTPFLAGLVWRWEAVKSWFTGNDPLLTKETARTASAKVNIDNGKFRRHFADFQYQPVSQSVVRICGELKKLHNLS